jgi:hypothetical protein
MSNVIDLNARRPRGISEVERAMLMRVLADVRRVCPEAVLQEGVGDCGDPWASVHAHKGDCDPMLTWTRINGCDAWLDVTGEEIQAPKAAEG